MCHFQTLIRDSKKNENDGACIYVRGCHGNKEERIEIMLNRELTKRMCNIRYHANNKFRSRITAIHKANSME